METRCSMQGSGSTTSRSTSESLVGSAGVQLDKEGLQVLLDEGENFYPLLESSIEDTMADGSASLCSFMDKFKQLHESKVRSMNLEQIDDYCREFLEALGKKK